MRAYLPARAYDSRCGQRPLLEVVRWTGSFLYRGETLSPYATRGGGGGSEGRRPRAVVETPDLLDEGMNRRTLYPTVGFFARLDVTAVLVYCSALFVCVDIFSQKRLWCDVLVQGLSCL